VVLYVPIAGYSVWRLWYKIVRLLLLLLMMMGLRLLLLRAEEAEGPVREIEATKDDDGCEDLGKRLVS
jgi:hypothetical protein